MRVLALLVAALVSGCVTTASMVEERGASRYGPSNERAGGLIKYRMNGPGWAVAERREDAYRQMFDRCGGKYAITSEQDVAVGQVSTASATAVGRTAYGSGVGVLVVDRMIEFECEAGAVAGR